jgi:HEAT repeat protein
MIRAAKSSPLLAEFIGAAVLIAGCGNRSPEPDPAVTAVIAATRYNSPSALAEINRLAALSPAALRAAAVAQIGDPAPAVRDAARYALAVSVTAEDAAAVAALRDLLDADDDAGRLTAAGGLLSIGDKPAVPVLIDLLGSTAKVPFADPPMQSRGLCWSRTRIRI